MTLDSLLGSVERVSNAIGRYGGAGLLILLIGVMAYEVGARHLFGAPTRWALEYSTFIQVMLVAVTGAYILNEDGHVHIGLFTEMMPVVWQHRLHAFGSVLGALFCALLATQMWFAAAWAWKVKTASDTMGVPIAPVQFVLFAGLALLALQFLARSIRYARRARAASRGLDQYAEQTSARGHGVNIDG